MTVSCYELIVLSLLIPLLKASMYGKSELQRSTVQYSTARAHEQHKYPYASFVWTLRIVSVAVWITVFARRSGCCFNLFQAITKHRVLNLLPFLATAGRPQGPFDFSVQSEYVTWVSKV